MMTAVSPPMGHRSGERGRGRPHSADTPSPAPKCQSDPLTTQPPPTPPSGSGKTPAAGPPAPVNVVDRGAGLPSSAGGRATVICRLAINHTVAERGSLRGEHANLRVVRLSLPVALAPVRDEP